MRLLSSRLFLLFLVAIGCTHGAHATFYTFGALHWQAQGLSAAWVGVLWAIGVTAEVILFAFSAPVVRRFSAAQLIVAGAGGALVRWTAMAFDPPLALLVPLQTLHALTYSAAHLGAILFITRAVSPKGQGSAQAFYSVIAAGVILGIVGLISGALYRVPRRPRLSRARGRVACWAGGRTRAHEGMERRRRVARGGSAGS